MVVRNCSVYDPLLRQDQRRHRTKRLLLSLGCVPSKRLYRSPVISCSRIVTRQAGGTNDKVSRRKRDRQQRSQGAPKSTNVTATLQDCLRDAASLTEVATKRPGAALQCMQKFATVPARSIHRDDLADSVEAIVSIVASATNVRVRAKARLLSDLGKTLQAQPTLKKRVQTSPEIQKHVSRLFDLAAEDQDLFTNPVCVSQLAIAQVKIGQYRESFWERLELMRPGCLPARAFSNVVYSAAKLHAIRGAPRPSPAFERCFMSALEADACHLVRQMNPQELTNVWWALAKLDINPSAVAAPELNSATVQTAPRMVPQDVANTWWAFATLRMAVPDATCDAMQAASIRTAPRMVPQAVANTWWAFATLGIAVPHATCDALQAASIRTAPRMVLQDVANTWWAFVTLRMAVPDATCDALQAASIRTAPRMVPQDVANTWWAFATLRMAVPDATCDALQAASIRTAPRMVPQEVANTWWAFATLGMAVPASVVEALCATLTRLKVTHSMLPQDAANVLWAFGALAAVSGVEGPVPSDGTHGGDPDSHPEYQSPRELLGVHSHVVSAVADELLQLYQGGASFQDKGLVQVHYVSEIHGLQRIMGPQAQLLLEECRVAAVEMSETKQLDAQAELHTCNAIGAKHRAVLKALKSLQGLSDVEICVEAPVGDGSRRVDILLHGRGVRVAVEVDGPSHFVKDSAGISVRENGATALRIWQLRRWGYAVLSVPVAGKTPAQLRSPQHQAWLLQELQKRGVA